MVFNATFNNISAISWRSVLLFEETGVPGENHRPVCRKSLTKLFIKVGTDCIGSCKSNYHIITIKTTMATISRLKNYKK